MNEMNDIYNNRCYFFWNYLYFSTVLVTQLSLDRIAVLLRQEINTKTVLRETAPVIIALKLLRKDC